MTLIIALISCTVVDNVDRSETVIGSESMIITTCDKQTSYPAVWFGPGNLSITKENNNSVIRFTSKLKDDWDEEYLLGLLTGRFDNGLGGGCRLFESKTWLEKKLCLERRQTVRRLFAKTPDFIKAHKADLDIAKAEAEQKLEHGFASGNCNVTVQKRPVRK